VNAGQHLDPDAYRWVGWHSFELTGQHGSVITIDLRAGRDNIEITTANNLLAVLDRDEFRDWLAYPAPRALTKDEVEWSVHSGVSYLTLGEAAEYGTYAVPGQTIAYLTGVI
jgi:hypothetical protein